MKYYQLIAVCLLIIAINSNNAMLRLATATSMSKNNGYQKRFSSSSPDQIRGYIALARIAVQHNDWKGVQGQAALFAHKHASLAELKISEQAMNQLIIDLEKHFYRIIEDAEIINLGLDALKFQMRSKEEGVLGINLNFMKNTQTKK